MKKLVLFDSNSLKMLILFDMNPEKIVFGRIRQHPIKSLPSVRH